MSWFRRKKHPRVEDLDTDAMQRPIWPKEVLAAAREGLISSGYCTGAEDEMRAGDFDHWPAMQAACYALCEHLDVSEIMGAVPPGRKAREIALTVEQELEMLAREVENDLASINDELNRMLGDG